MKKVLLIGWKDVTLAFRDRAALILMLAAPFLLTVGLGFVTGRFSGTGDSGVSDIAVVVVNQDGGQIGNALVDLLQSPDLDTLLAPSVVDDPALARQQVDDDKAAAAVIIPAGFTASIIPTGRGDVSSPSALVQLEIYANPTRPTTAGIVRTIVEQFLSEVEVSRAGAQVVVTQLLSQGLIQPQDAAQVGAAVGARQAQAAQGSSPIALKSTTGDVSASFDPLAYMAPGMALMFLMFTAANGGRTLLSERAQGTLPRLLVSPTSSAQVLGGKVLGIYLTGVAQMLILIGASTLLFSLRWGDPLGVVALVLAAVAGAVGWGMLITALAKTPGQINAIGSAIMLIFGILGGSFLNTDYMPKWFNARAKITPNAWGLDGFTILGLGGGLGDLSGPIAALLAMGALLFAVAVVLMNRRGIAQA
jgi:ABC-2 type transport system permease protein